MDEDLKCKLHKSLKVKRRSWPQGVPGYKQCSHRLLFQPDDEEARRPGCRLRRERRVLEKRTLWEELGKKDWGALEHCPHEDKAMGFQHSIRHLSVIL